MAAADSSDIVVVVTAAAAGGLTSRCVLLDIGQVLYVAFVYIQIRYREKQSDDVNCGIFFSKYWTRFGRLRHARFFVEDTQRQQLITFADVYWRLLQCTA